MKAKLNFSICRSVPGYVSVLKFSDFILNTKSGLSFIPEKLVSVSAGVRANLMNVRPKTVFPPLAKFFEQHGIISSSVEQIQSEFPVPRDSLTEAFKQLDQVAVPVKGRLDRQTVRDAVKCSLNLLFPNGVPSLNICIDTEVLISKVNKRANFGYPHLDKKKGDLIDELDDVLRKIVSGGVSLRAFSELPITIFTRWQFRDSKLKLRLVYCVSAYIILFEMLYHHSLAEWFSTNSTCYVVGKTRKEVSSLMRIHKQNYTYCLDYSKFDLRLRHEFISLSFGIVLLTYKDVIKSTYLDNFVYVVHYFMYGCLFHPLYREGSLSHRERGVPSGSQFTNLIDSIASVIVICYALVKTRQIWKLSVLQVHGDDLVLSSKVKINLEQICQVLEEVGMVISIEKSTFFDRNVDKVDFLGYTWDEGLPIGDFDNMVLQALTIQMYEIDLPLKDKLQAMVYTIFGNDSRLVTFWKRCGWSIPKEVYVLPGEIHFGDPSQNLVDQKVAKIPFRTDEWMYR